MSARCRRWRLQVLRALEEQLIKGATHNLIARTRPDVALYVLNQKRAHLRSLEERFAITITISADESVRAPQAFIVDRGEQVHTIEAAKALAERVQAVAAPLEEEDDLEDSGAVEEEQARRRKPRQRRPRRLSKTKTARRRRRRRRRRGGRNGGEGAHGQPHGERDEEPASSTTSKSRSPSRRRIRRRLPITNPRRTTNSPINQPGLFRRSMRASRAVRATGGGGADAAVAGAIATAMATRCTAETIKARTNRGRSSLRPKS